MHLPVFCFCDRSVLYFSPKECYNAVNCKKDVTFSMKAAFSKLFTKKNLYRLLIAFFSVVFLVSAGFLADYIISSIKQRQQLKELSELIGSKGEKYVYVIHPNTGETVKILEEYATLFELNPDFIGWIKVDNTIIDYPVMQKPDWRTYYLQRDFYGTYNKHGTIYVTETADVKAPSDNMTIFGHRMNDGTMFSDLLKYKDEEFFKKSPTITFNTIYDYREYQILSVFVTAAYYDTYFPYYAFVDGDAEDFEDYVDECKALSLYDTGVTAVDGDKLITLSTCDNVVKNGRVVIVAKQIK